MCKDFNVYYHHPSKTLGNSSAKISVKLPDHCSIIQLPIPLPTPSKLYASDLFELLTSNILLEWELSNDCHHCLEKGGKCLIGREHKFHCSKGKKEKSKLRMILAAVFSGVGLILVSSIVILSIWRYKRRKNDSTQLRRELEVESRYFGFQVPVFSYAELKEATNNFDSSMSLEMDVLGLYIMENYMMEEKLQ